MGSRKKTEKIHSLLPYLKDKHLEEVKAKIDYLERERKFQQQETKITPKGQKGFNIPDAPGTATEEV